MCLWKYRQKDRLITMARLFIGTSPRSQIPNALIEIDYVQVCIAIHHQSFRTFAEPFPNPTFTRQTQKHTSDFLLKHTHTYSRCATRKKSTKPPPCAPYVARHLNVDIITLQTRSFIVICSMVDHIVAVPEKFLGTTAM